MKKTGIIICRGDFFYKYQINPFGRGELIPALYRQYQIGDFIFEVEISRKYAIIQHIHPSGDWSIDLLRNTSNKSMLEAKGCLMDFLLDIPSIYGVYEKFIPCIEWGD